MRPRSLRGGSIRGTGARVVLGWLAAMAGAGVIARGAVAMPEHCGDATPSSVGSAIDTTVGWFATNQHPDGTWLYRYHAHEDRDLGGYNWVRHAGVMLSLYQAARDGVPVALEVADRGRAVALDAQLVRAEDWAALRDADTLTAGGTSLLVVALGERRVATGRSDDDDLLRALGRFLARMVEPDGSVLNTAYLDGVAVPDSQSTFTTGEAFFALARLHNLFPGEGWNVPAERIARYVITERADREGFVPDMSDHWSAYGFAELRRWPEREATGLDAAELGFARRQLGLMSIQTRYETQRTNGGVSRWLRGRQALGAAIGTIGEAFGQWWEVGAREPALDGRRAATRDRLVCMAGAIVERQVDAAEATSFAAPDAVRGAHLQFGITQMDDQQHTLSALVFARRVLADPTPLPRRSPTPTNVWLVALAAIAALNPVRLAAGSTGSRAGRRRAVGLAGAGTVGATALAAALGGPLLRALDVSAGNGLVAAAIVLVAGGLYGLANPDEAQYEAAQYEAARRGLLVPLLVPLGLRPDLLLFAVACGAGGRGWLVVGAVAVAAATATGIASSDAPKPVVQRWLMRVVGTLATATALALLVDGVFAI